MIFILSAILSETRAYFESVIFLFFVGGNWNKRNRMPSPKISVLMPVWNGERFLAEAVESILAQTFADFELIAVDGGSTDRTLEILVGYRDPRIRIFQAPPGIVPALNFGIARARGNWIARHDADDISLPQRLALQWAAINRKPDVVLCHTDVALTGENIEAIGRARFPRSQAFLALKLCYQCPIVHGSVLFKKEAVLAVGGYQGQQAEDYGLWGRLIENGRVIGIPKKLVRFRIHEVSASKRHREVMTAAAEKIAIEHCRRFMNLSNEDARRAHGVLVAHGKCRWPEWSWFLRHCTPRLRWKSAETYAWLGWQTLKTLF
ncbi:MAG TPA: glycosyltransferase [Verrucomicrobiae bacterium]|nr:glycosyltransferase [Verrucomicrobiae bacterium]